MMRKRLISAYIVVILAGCICSCAQTAENAPAAETENEEQGIEPDLYYIMDEMLSLFKAGDVASQNHRYELFVEDITWEQAGYNVVDLHFVFEDTVIDREIVAYDVRDIVYQDITGDGIDEALIYCDFANNTCDWQLIYFYRIDQGNVTDITPSSVDIPELNNADWGIWNMWWVAAATMEGYSSPIYKLEDYNKENGIVYVEETLYIGYRDGKWELVQGF